MAIDAVQATSNPFATMSAEQRKEFLSDLPSMLEAWYTGAAMGSKFNVTAGPMSIKWGTGGFRSFLKWCVFLQSAIPQKPMTLYRMVGIPATSKDRFRLVTRNPVHSWTTSLPAARHLYALAYKDRIKVNAKWNYLILQTDMPADRVALTYPQALKLTKWAIKNFDKLYASTGLDGTGLYSKKNLLQAWNSLWRVLNTKLISNQFEVICVGSKPTPVTVVERLQ